VSDAANRFTRMVSLVAELTRAADRGAEPETIASLAKHFGVTERQVNEDIAQLTIVGDRSSADWLLSLRVWMQGENVSITSAGPFRRPVRLSPEEQLAIQIALTLEPGGEALRQRLAEALSGAPGGGQLVKEESATPSMTATLRNAIASGVAVEIDYAGEGAHQIQRRTIHPYQLAELGLRSYVVAWSPDVNAWRHFRLDRMANASPTMERFERRDDFVPISSPDDTFRPGGSTDDVVVRFRPEAAPWVKEFYDEHSARDDGSVEVTFRTSSTEWLTRRVLEFGGDAEVIAPPRYRDALRRAIA
jgi:proteasome accessory factor C